MTFQSRAGQTALYGPQSANLRGTKRGLWLRLGESLLAPEMGAVLGDLGPESLF